ISPLPPPFLLLYRFPSLSPSQINMSGIGSWEKSPLISPADKLASATTALVHLLSELERLVKVQESPLTLPRPPLDCTALISSFCIPHSTKGPWNCQRYLRSALETACQERRSQQDGVYSTCVFSLA